MIHLVAASHGTDNEQGRATIDLIRAQLAALLEEGEPGAYRVHEAYVDVQEPSLNSVLAGFGEQEQVVVVPLLLSTGYHTQVDVVKAAQASPAQVRIARALGPSVALAGLQRRRLEEAGWEGRGRLVMAAAGSSRVDGREAVEAQSQVFSTLISQFAPHGFVAAIDPKITDVADETQAEFISSYLLGQGFFQRQLVKLGQSLGAEVAQPLVLPGDDDAARVVAEVAAERLGEALGDL